MPRLTLESGKKLNHRRFILRVDVVNDDLQPRWFTLFTNKDGADIGNGGVPNLHLRTNYAGPADEVVVVSTRGWFVRVATTDGSILYYDEAFKQDHWVGHPRLMTYDVFRDCLYVASQPSWDFYADPTPGLLARYDVDTGESVWTVDYRASFEDLGELEWQDAKVAALNDGSINLVLFSTEAGTQIARLTGDAPGGPFAPSPEPTPCVDAGKVLDAADITAGGVSAAAGALVVADNVSFVGCASASDGGSLSAVDAAVRLRDCKLEGSSSAGGGGGVAVAGGSHDVVRTTISDVLEPAWDLETGSPRPTRIVRRVLTPRPRRGSSDGVALTSRPRRGSSANHPRRSRGVDASAGSAASIDSPGHRCKPAKRAALSRRSTRP